MMTSVIADNIDIDVYPFKGPFKGKGANRKAINQLKVDLLEIKSVMESVIVDFAKVMQPTKRVVSLTMFRPRGIPQLWWRTANKKATYLKLFGSEEGNAILAGMLPEAIDFFIRHERKRLHYNLQATMIGHALEHYRNYVEGNEIMDKLSRQLIQDDFTVECVKSVNA
ncbi:MAG: hypothetical protein ACI9FD_003485 [Gammaproteobacteria bacterium]|jgi:hypothetical protein